MADINKRYFWLKLNENFFRDKRIKKLRKIAGGDTFTIIYLKMQLLSLQNNGFLIFEGIEDTFEEELALELDEDIENVKITLAFLHSNGMIEETEQDHFLMTETVKCIGSETASAERVRRHRQPTNCNSKENQHIPFIDKHTNNKRYNGNYYKVMKRDNFKCAICNSVKNLCVHHIDGYDTLKPQNNNKNKMIVLCRHCHSNIHAGKEIPSVILENINYNNNKKCHKK